MTNNHLTPHDKYFKSVMADIKVAREFFEQNLPIYIKSVVNFATIKLQKESFIDDKLRLQIADLLYSTEFGTKTGYLYVLVEHQSTPDKLMAFRVLKYMVAIMEHHVKQTKTDKLPVVYPMIFYTGNKHYSYSTDLFDLFGDKKDLAKDILWQPYQLIDLSKIPDEKLKKFLRYGIIARTMKHIYEKDFLPTLRELVKDLRAVEEVGDMDYIYQLLSYIIEAGELNRQDFIETIKTSLNQTKEENVMTLAEQFRQEGRQEGYEKAKATLSEQFKNEGRIEGEQKGKLETAKSIATKLLSQGMVVDQVATITGLSVCEVEQLKNNVSN